MNQIGIETTQHVKLYYNTAQVGDRIIAFLLDGIILLGYYFVVSLMFGIAEDMDWIEPTFTTDYMWLTVLIYTIPTFLYHLVMEATWNGKSFGKWLIGLQVVSVDGEPPTLGQYLIRWLLRLIEITMSMGLIAFITVLSNGRGQRLGDWAAKTCVIKTKKSVKLRDTIYSELGSGFEAKYPEAAQLTDKDISTIKEVLSSKKVYDYSTWFVMIQRTANIIQNKIGIRKFEVNADQFLQQLIDDYNHLHNE